MTTSPFPSKSGKAIVRRESFQDLNELLEATGGMLVDLAPTRIGIIRDSLLGKENVRERFAIVLELLADVIAEHDHLDDLLFAVNEYVARLSACLQASEDSFYEEEGDVERARMNLYALQSGFKHSQGDPIDLFVVDQENFLRGSAAYWTRLTNLLRNKHEDFLEQDRKRPTYIATTWSMESSSEVQTMCEFGEEVLMISVHTLPYFETDDLQLEYLDQNPIHGTNSTNAFAVVLNSLANVGAYRDSKSRKARPLPVPVHLAFAARMSTGEVGANLSGNGGIGLLVENAKDAQVVRYRRSNSRVRKEMLSRGVLTLTGRHIRGHATTCVGGDKPAYEDYSAMDAYVTICRSMEQYMVDLIDGSWTADSEEKLRNELKRYFDDLFAPTPGQGRKVLFKAVKVDEEVKIVRNEATGEVQIFAPIQLPGVINGASITVDPVLPDQNATE